MLGRTENQQNIQITKVKSVATPPSEQEPDSAIKSIHSDTSAPSISKFCSLQEPGPTSLRSPGVDRCLSGELGGSPFESQILPDPSTSFQILRNRTLIHFWEPQLQALHRATSKQDKPPQKSLKSPNWISKLEWHERITWVPYLFQDSVLSSSKACETWRMSTRWVIMTEHVTCCMVRYCQCIPMPLLSRFACGLRAARCLLSSSTTNVVSVEKHISQAAGLLLYSESLPTSRGYLMAKEGDALVKMSCERFVQTVQRKHKELHQQVYIHRVGKNPDVFK